MKKLKQLFIEFLVACLIISTCNCAGLKKHPVITGMVIGAAAGATIAIVTRHTCPNTYDGKPYQGTPPCPK